MASSSCQQDMPRSMTPYPADPMKSASPKKVPVKPSTKPESDDKDKGEKSKVKIEEIEEAGEGGAGRDPSSEDGGGTGRLMMLWDSLRSLRQRMQATESATTATCPHRLEATEDINTNNTNMSPTRNLPDLTEDSPSQQHGTTSTTSTTNHACPTSSPSAMASFPAAAAYDRPICSLSTSTRSSPSAATPSKVAKELATTWLRRRSDLHLLSGWRWLQH